MSMREVQDEIRELISKTMWQKKKRLIDVIRECNLGKTAVYRWFSGEGCTRYLTICRLLYWLLDNNKERDIKIKTLDLFVKKGDEYVGR